MRRSSSSWQQPAALQDIGSRSTLSEPQWDTLQNILMNLRSEAVPQSKKGDGLLKDLEDLDDQHLYGLLKNVVVALDEKLVSLQHMLKWKEKPGAGILDKAFADQFCCEFATAPELTQETIAGIKAQLTVRKKGQGDDVN